MMCQSNCWRGRSALEQTREAQAALEVEVEGRRADQARVAGLEKRARRQRTKFHTLSTALQVATGEGPARWSGRSSRRHSTVPADIAVLSEFQVDETIENRLRMAVCRYRGCEREREQN